METLLELNDITKIYNQDHVVLNHLQFQCNKGEFIAIVGKSGSGKTTFVNIVGQLDTKYEGQYLFQGKDVLSLDLIGHKISFIFQNYNLIDRFTVYQNILLPTYYSQEADKDIENKVQSIMEELAIIQLKDKKINTLSGGEKQRVAIARSMMMSPDLLIADEPTGNLDKENAYLVMKLFERMKKQNKTIILITHDDELSRFTDRTYLLENGTLHEKV